MAVGEGYAKKLAQDAYAAVAEGHKANDAKAAYRVAGGEWVFHGALNSGLVVVIERISIVSIVNSFAEFSRISI